MRGYLTLTGVIIVSGVIIIFFPVILINVGSSANQELHTIVGGSIIVFGLIYYCIFEGFKGILEEFFGERKDLKT